MESWLARLADEGLDAFPPAKLDAVASWCRDYCFASGEVAYCVLSDLLLTLHVAWEGPVRVDTAESMSRALTRDIPTILDADPETARIVALALREEVLQILSAQSRR